MKPGINWVADDTVFVMPDFIHEIGDRFHHTSAREFSHRRYVIHEFIDELVLYPIADWIDKWVGDNKLGQLLREILGFFWGFNCGFPPRDVALYIVWCFRCCPARAVFKRREGKWIRTYP